MTQASSASLADRLYHGTGRLRGAPEHSQIAYLLSTADRYRLSDETTTELTETLHKHTSSIEQNIDLIRPANRATWIEYADAPRRREETAPLFGAAHPVNVGALICKDDDNEDRLVIVTGWDFADGSVRHSYAAASVSLTSMARLAWAARTRLSKDPEDGIHRLLDQVTAFVPPGLAEEIDVLERIDHPLNPDQAIADRLKASKFDVVSEMPFLFAALLAISAGTTVGDVSGPGEPKIITLQSIPKPRMPWRRAPGFRRIDKKPMPSLEWLSPAA